MHRIKLHAIALLLVVCFVCFTGCQPILQMLSLYQQLNSGQPSGGEEGQGNAVQPDGSYLVASDGIAFQVTIPEGWYYSSGSGGVLCLRATDGNGKVEAYFIIHTRNKAVSQTLMEWVTIVQKHEREVEYGQGEDIQGNKTMWMLAEGTFRHVTHIPNAFGDGYLLLYVDDETGADSFGYLEELAGSVVSVAGH